MSKVIKLLLHVRPKVFEAYTLSQCMILYRGNKSQVASSLGIQRDTLNRMLDRNPDEIYIKVLHDGVHVTSMELINK